MIPGKLQMTFRVLPLYSSFGLEDVLFKSKGHSRTDTHTMTIVTIDY